jgi:hypothetical protein
MHESGHLLQIFTTQMKVYLRYQIQGLPKLGVRNNIFIKSEWVTYPEVGSTSVINPLSVS